MSRTGQMLLTDTEDKIGLNRPPQQALNPAAAPGSSNLCKWSLAAQHTEAESGADLLLEEVGEFYQAYNRTLFPCSLEWFPLRR